MVNFGKKLAIEHRDQMKLSSSIFGKKHECSTRFQAFWLEISALKISELGHQPFKTHKTNSQKTEGFIARFLFFQNKPVKPKIIGGCEKLKQYVGISQQKSRPCPIIMRFSLQDRQELSAKHRLIKALFFPPLPRRGLARA